VDQKQALRILARHVMTQLELRRRSHELADAAARHKGMEDDIQELRAELQKARKLLRKRVKARPAAKAKKTRKRG